MNDSRFLTDEGIDDFEARSYAKSLQNGSMALAISARGLRLRFLPPVAYRTTLRGNGHCDNPRGPLQPGDYGVHSHPDTARLLNNDGPAELPRRRDAGVPRS